MNEQRWPSQQPFHDQQTFNQPEWPPQQYPQQPSTGYGPPQQPIPQQLQWNQQAPPQYGYPQQSGQFQPPPYTNPQSYISPRQSQFPPYNIPQPSFNPVQYQYLRKAGLWITILAFASLFFLVLSHIGSTTTPTATATLNTYCNALKNHDYQTAYDQFSTQSSQFKNEAEFASAYDYADKFFGGLTDCTVGSVNENDSSGISNGRVWFTYADGTTNTLNARLINESGTWRITN